MDPCFGKRPQADEQLSPRTTTTEAAGSGARGLQLLKPAHPGACALQQEATAMRSPCTTEELPPLTTTRERLNTVTKTQGSQNTHRKTLIKKKEKKKSFVSCGFGSVIVQSLGRARLFVTHGLQHTSLPCSSPSPGVCSNSCPLSQGGIQPSHPLSSPSPFALSLPQHQGLFQ